jgi:hypothetical protein
MSKCIQVTLKDGSIVTANVSNGVTKLPQSDVDALEQFVAFVKARHVKKKVTQPHKQGENQE